MVPFSDIWLSGMDYCVIISHWGGGSFIIIIITITIIIIIIYLWTPFQ